MYMTHELSSRHKKKKVDSLHDPDDSKIVLQH